MIRYIVSNRSFTFLFFTILLAAAWIKLPDLRISQYPVVKLPTLMVQISLPGASANEIEQRVVNLIEEKLQNTRRLFKVTTNIYNSHATIVVRFEYGIDIDDEYVEMNSKINNIKSSLPAQTEISVLKQSPIDRVVSFVLGISSATASEKELKQASDLLSQALRQLGSLEKIDEIFPNEEIRIDLNLARIESSRLRTRTIKAAIQGNNQYLPTGTFNIGDKSLSVLAFGNGYRNLEEIRNTLVMNQTGKALALRDFATVRRVHQDSASQVYVNGVPSMLVTMKLSETANIYQTRKAIAGVLDQIVLPANVEVVWLFDAQGGVDYKLNGLVANIATGVGILALVLLFSVGLRSAFIITATLPAALLLSVIGLSFTDYGIQEISLAGFIIALGLIVDNGIVVTENAFKLNHYQGYSHEDAAIVGTSSVVMPLFSSTATTVLAFAPLFLLTSTTGLFLHSLVAVIWLCLGASLIAAIIISSVITARIGTENRVRFLPSPPSFLIALIPFRDGVYRTTLGFFIRRPLVLLMIIFALITLAGYAATRLTVILFPASEDPYFTVSIEAPLDRNKHFVGQIVADIDEQLRERPEIEHCSSVRGASFPMVHTGSATVPTRRNTGQIFCSVNFRDAVKLSALIKDINTSLTDYSALALIKAAPFSVGGSGDLADLSVQLKGPNIQQIRQLSGELEQHIKDAGLTGVASISNAAQSRYFALHIDYKEKRANALGVERQSVDQILVLLTHGTEIDKFRDRTGDELPIVLRVESDSDAPLELFDRVFINSTSGARIPLSQVVDVRFAEDEYDI
ncbi:MAG: efflux RND transporter permease subunit, partial [Gammaproteobacteria bacterium]|nr:efflux RND transporter permease subunit [Gammaproteobacteria bacterium]